MKLIFLRLLKPELQAVNASQLCMIEHSITAIEYKLQTLLYSTMPWAALQMSVQGTGWMRCFCMRQYIWFLCKNKQIVLEHHYWQSQKNQVKVRYYIFLSQRCIICRHWLASASLYKHCSYVQIFCNSLKHLKSASLGSKMRKLTEILFQPDCSVRFYVSTIVWNSINFYAFVG